MTYFLNYIIHQFTTDFSGKKKKKIINRASQVMTNCPEYIYTQ